MPLSFDFKNINNYETICYTDDGEIAAVTNALIYGTIFTGIGEITEQNAAEFYARLHTFELLVGAIVSGSHALGGVDTTITPDTIKAHIGLKTNASFTDSTRAKWLKNMVGNQLDTFAGQYRQNTASTTTA